MTPPPVIPSDASPPPPSRSAGEIRDWLVAKLAEAENVEPAEISCDHPLIAMGLDSMRSLVLVGELEQWLGCRFTDNPLIEFPTINTLAVYLADQLARGNRLLDTTDR